MAELKPCPFCGSKANEGCCEIKVDAVRRNIWYYVQCYGCGYDSECFRTKEEATEAWNKWADLTEPPKSEVHGDAYTRAQDDDYAEF